MKGSNNQFYKYILRKGHKTTIKVGIGSSLSRFSIRVNVMFEWLFIFDGHLGYWEQCSILIIPIFLSQQFSLLISGGFQPLYFDIQKESFVH